MKIDRKAVYNKYNGRCAYCGREIEYKDMQVDHLIPQIRYDDPKNPGDEKGDKNDFDNLMPSCRTCNHYKRAEGLEYFRVMIEEIPRKLSQRNYIYKVGMAYGFYDSKEREVKFYFEKCKESEEMPENDLEQFRIRTYIRAQADLAERIRYLLTHGDVVDVLKLLDEVEEKGQELIKCEQ